jgi:hypothetical protein
MFPLLLFESWEEISRGFKENYEYSLEMPVWIKNFDDFHDDSLIFKKIFFVGLKPRIIHDATKVYRFTTPFIDSESINIFNNIRIHQK